MRALTPAAVVCGHNELVGRLGSGTDEIPFFSKLGEDLTKLNSFSTSRETKSQMAKRLKAELKHCRKCMKDVNEVGLKRNQKMRKIEKRLSDSKLMKMAQCDKAVSLCLRAMNDSEFAALYREQEAERSLFGRVSLLEYYICRQLKNIDDFITDTPPSVDKTAVEAIAGIKHGHDRSVDLQDRAGEDGIKDPVLPSDVQETRTDQLRARLPPAAADSDWFDEHTI